MVLLIKTYLFFSCYQRRYSNRDYKKRVLRKISFYYFLVKFDMTPMSDHLISKDENTFKQPALLVSKRKEEGRDNVKNSCFLLAFSWTTVSYPSFTFYGSISTCYTPDFLRLYLIFNNDQSHLSILWKTS